MSIRKIFIKNASTNALLQVVTILSGFILSPLIVSTYGSVVNGMVISVRQFISRLMLVEAGISATGLVALYPALAKKNHPLCHHILASICHFYRISGTLFSIGLIALACFYAWLTQHQLRLYFAFWVVLVLDSVNILDFFFFGTCQILTIAEQKNDKQSFIDRCATIS